MKRRIIKTVGTINLKDVYFDFRGQIEVHMPLEEIKSEADLIIHQCMNKYKKKYPKATDRNVYQDFRLVFTSGIDNPEYSEFMAMIYIWQRSDEETGQDTCEMYEGYKLNLDDADKKTVKRIISDRMYEMITVL